MQKAFKWNADIKSDADISTKPPARRFGDCDRIKMETGTDAADIQQSSVVQACQDSDAFKDLNLHQWSPACVKIKQEPGLSNPDENTPGHSHQSLTCKPLDIKIKEEIDNDYQDPTMDVAGEGFVRTGRHSPVKVKEEMDVHLGKYRAERTPGSRQPDRGDGEVDHPLNCTMDSTPKLRLPTLQKRDQASCPSRKMEYVSNCELPSGGVRDNMHHPNFTTGSLPKLRLPQGIIRNEVDCLNHRLDHVPLYRSSNQDAGGNVYSVVSTTDSASQMWLPQEVMRVEANHRSRGVEHASLCGFPVEDVQEKDQALNFSVHSISPWRSPCIQRTYEAMYHNEVYVPFCKLPSGDVGETAHSLNLIKDPICQFRLPHKQNGEGASQVIQRMTSFPYFMVPDQVSDEGFALAKDFDTESVTNPRRSYESDEVKIGLPTLTSQAKPAYRLCGGTTSAETSSSCKMRTISDGHISETMEKARKLQRTNGSCHSRSEENIAGDGRTPRVAMIRGNWPCRIASDPNGTVPPRMTAEVERYAFGPSQVVAAAVKQDGKPCAESAHSRHSSPNSDVAAMALEYRSHLPAKDERTYSESMVARPRSLLSSPPHTLTLTEAKSEKETSPDTPTLLGRTGFRSDPPPITSGMGWVSPVFVCALCKVNFASLSHLKAHSECVHHRRPAAGLPYPHCGQNFPSCPGLERHADTDHRNRFPCPQCKKLFTRKYRLKEHVEIVHSDSYVKKHECKPCGKRFAWRNGLKRHLDTCHGSGEKRCTCSLCGRTFTEKGTLKPHVDDLHRESGGLVCPPCQETFLCFLKKHPVHSGGDKHMCPKFGQTFTEKGNLQSHLDTVHRYAKRYSCPACSKLFSRRSGMRNHFKTVHCQVRQPCPRCDKHFTEKGSLTKHLVTQHSPDQAGRQAGHHSTPQLDQSWNKMMTSPTTKSHVSSSLAKHMPLKLEQREKKACFYK